MSEILEHSPLVAMSVVGKRPVLIIHSSDDQTVSIDHSYQLEVAAEEAGANAEFWYIEGADHVQAPGVYPDEYARRITEFFARNLGSE